MALSIEQFLNHLTTSELLSNDDVRALIAALPEDKRPRDGEALARELVSQKKLTKFQAEQIFGGKGKSLTLGNYVILDKLSQGGMGVVLKARHKRMKLLLATSGKVFTRQTMQYLVQHSKLSEFRTK